MIGCGTLGIPLRAWSEEPSESDKNNIRETGEKDALLND
jgi:hypothetical protein